MACLQGSAAFKALSDQIAKSQTSQETLRTDLMERWTLQTQKFAQQSMSSETILEFEPSSGKLKIGYDDQTLKALRQMRQLSSTGQMLPEKLLAWAEKAQRQSGYGMVLKQLSHFYNSIEKQIYGCQRAMLIDKAVAFENAIRSSQTKDKTKMLSWKDTRALESYLASVQGAADELTKANRYLQSVHKSIMERVIRLFDVDLINEFLWKKEINEIKKTIAEIEVQGYSKENLAPWVSHLQQQVWKVVGIQFARGLQTLTTNLPTIEVEIVYVQQVLQYRPTFEEIRARYVKEIARYLALPSCLNITERDDVSEGLLVDNMAQLAAVYKRSERMFTELASILEQQREWTLLAASNLESQIEQNLDLASDFELNFRQLKGKGRDAEKLPNEMRVDTILVKFTQLKSLIDSSLQRFSEALITVLKQRITDHVKNLDSFIDEGTRQLAFQPQTIDELKATSPMRNALLTEMSKMSSLYSEIENKQKLLRSVVSIASDTSVQVRWTQFHNRVASHEGMLQQQMAQIRKSIEDQVISVRTKTELFLSKWSERKPKPEAVHGAENANRFAVVVQDSWREFLDISEQARKLKEDCLQASIAEPSFPALSKAEIDIKEALEKWNVVADYNKDFDALAAQQWVVIREKLNDYEEKLIEWERKLGTLNDKATTAFIAKDLLQKRDLLPLLKMLRGEHWNPQHWDELFRILRVVGKVDVQHFTLNILLSSAVTAMAEHKAIHDLNARALAESSIRGALSELESWAVMTTFSTTKYTSPSGKSLSIIKDWKDTITSVGDKQSLMSSIKDSPYFKTYAENAQVWEERLVTLSLYVQMLNVVQRKWVYLEPIFARGALPSQSSRFAAIDDDFCGIMNSVAKDSKILTLLRYPGIKDVLGRLTEQLERCQRSLADFLEEKRSTFARFYFLGDDDLLEILGQAKNPMVIQSHLKKLFAGIFEVSFAGDQKSISAFKSIDGEVVSLLQPVKVVEDVEIWLTHLTNEMRSTSRSSLGQCLHEKDMNKHSQQVLSVCDYIHFTADTSSAITKGKLSALISGYREELAKLTTHTQSSQNKSIVFEMKIKSMIMDVIHFLDVAETLDRKGVSDVDDWQWQKQLRYYFKEKDCMLRMGDADFTYTHEYQGNAQKLVHTPLTDKCYITLTQAMSNGYGGNPFGPAGTGKTESVKALGNAMGRQVLVFNCDEGIDYKSMGRIFAGLVQCGAWGCFDEFNRLDETVLSAVSQQIQVIQNALHANSQTVELLNQTLPIDINSSIFVTMNPAGKGYGGRQKLPDNLKQLFRAISMTRPDLDLIAEVMLQAEGYTQAKALGRKTVSIYGLSQRLLSNQQHYDWGLRALKSALAFSGLLRHQTDRNGVSNNAKTEADLMLRSIRSNVVPKLTQGDVISFEKLLMDTFCTSVSVESNQTELENAIQESYTALGLMPFNKQTEKIKQLLDATNQRMGVVLVGPTGSGKSTVWKVLKHALGITNRFIRTFVLNPKALTKRELLGFMDLDTREWHDGILTTTAREVARTGQDVRCWIICDGDVDPEWVEALNSVLDDNRLLTMPNGERIQFSSNVNFLFETHDLAFASPATISRMGMIYLSHGNIDTAMIVQSWIKGHVDNCENILSEAVGIILRGIRYVEDSRKIEYASPQLGILLNGLSMLESPSTKIGLIYAICRGLGSLLSDASADNLFTSLFQMEGCKVPTEFPSSHMYNDQSDMLDRYPSTFMQQAMGALPDDVQNVVLTAQFQRRLEVTIKWLSKGFPFLVFGPSGVGKTLLIEVAYANLKKEQSVTMTTFHCSSQTKASHFIQRLNQYCVTISSTAGRLLKPKDADTLLIVIKGLNLPKVDKYGTSEFIAFLCQLLTYEGFYRSDTEWVTVTNVRLVATCSPDSGYMLTERLTSRLRILWVPYPESGQLLEIYSALAQLELSASCANHKIWSQKSNIGKLVSSTISIYSSVRDRKTSHQHYIWTPRDLTKVFKRIARHTLSSLGAEDVVFAICSELLQAIGSRLVEADEKIWFHELLREMCKQWGINYSEENVFCSAKDLQETTISFCLIRRISVKDYEAAIDASLRKVNETRQISVLKVSEVIQNCSILEGTLSLNENNIVLAGKRGSGRRSTLHIAATRLGLEVQSLALSNGPSQKKEFQTQIRTITHKCGILGENVVLYVEHYLLKIDYVIERLNSLLTSGEIPDLYTPEELDALLGSLKEKQAELNFRGTLYELFLARIKKGLRVVINFDSLDPINTSLCDTNPALISRCEWIWFSGYSANSTDKLSIQVIPADAQSADPGFIKLIRLIHEKSGADSQTFFTFLRTYSMCFTQNYTILQTKRMYLEDGLRKLNEAGSQVDALAKKASSQTLLLNEKQEESDDSLVQITESMAAASVQKREAESLTIQLALEEKELIQKKELIEGQLKDVKPLLERTKEAVGSIRPEGLSEIRALKSPPEVVKDVLAGVLRMMGNVDESWTSMKSFLGKKGVREEILSFDARRISAETRNYVERLLQERPNSFVEANAKRASVVLEPMVMWIKANLQYSAILKKIEPLNIEYDRYNDSIETSRRKLSALSNTIANLDKNVAEMKLRFSKTTQQAEILKMDLETARNMLSNAQTLFQKLEGERSRWGAQTKSIQEATTRLPRTQLLVAAFVTYLGSHAEKRRQELVSEWKEMSQLTGFDFHSESASESERWKWKREGLPMDQLSQENAVIILNAISPPLLVDPTQQSVSWLKAHLPKIECIPANDEDLLRAVELAVRFGKSLLIIDCMVFNTALMPLLRRDIINQGSRRVIQIGAKLVEYNDNFKLFLATRNPGFVVPTEAISLLTIVNFSITSKGLSEQLLADLIRFESPHIESRRNELLKSEEELQLQLIALEDSLLQSLASSAGNILENKPLIDSLNDAKLKSTRIQESLSESRSIQSSLQKDRDNFWPFASFASKLYFIAVPLSRLNVMYTYSITAHMALFRHFLEKEGTHRNLDPQEFLPKLQKRFQTAFYEDVVRVLLNKDRLTFALHLVHELYPDEFVSPEWEFFIGMHLNAKSDDATPQKIAEWVPPDRRAAIGRLCQTFGWAASIMSNEPTRWKAWARNEEIQLPDMSNLRPFQQVLVIQAIKPEKLTTACT